MLNERLLACADFVRPGAQVCDVGTDHAQLPVYLVEQGIVARMIASDISEGPLKSAERTIAQHGLYGRIQTILSDGLRHIPPEGLTDVIIAGMGGETIIHILEDCPWKLDAVSLILQPMTKAHLLREWLYLHGFAIRKECCVRDGKFLYTVMLADFSGNAQIPDAVMRYIGKMDLMHPDCLAYAERQYEQLCKARDGRIQAGQNPSPFAEEAELLGKRLEEHNESSGRISGD